MENLGLPIQIQRERFESMVERFDLDAILDQKARRIFRAARCRLVNLACAMAVEPELFATR